MSGTLSRRSILKFFGASAMGVLAEPLASDLLCGAGAKAFAQGNQLSFTPVRLPTPLPIYTKYQNFLATGLGTGSVLPASDATRLDAYTVINDVVVPRIQTLRHRALGRARLPEPGGLRRLQRRLHRVRSDAA